MEIKNKYYKHSRLSEEKFEQLIHCFARDLSATEAATVTGISLRTTNTIYLKLRHRLAAIANARLRADYRAGANDMGDDDPALWPMAEVFGVRLRDSAVEANIIPKLSQMRLNAMIKEPAIISNLLSEGLRASWDKLVDFDLRSVLDLHPADHSVAPEGSLNAFLTFLKTRLQKFNGIASHTFHLHLQETAYRFNNRERNLEEAVLTMLLTRPLEFSSDHGISRSKSGEAMIAMAA